MCVAVGDIRGTAVVFAGVDLGFAQGLLQTGNTRDVFRIYRDVLIPGLAAVIGVAAGDGGHGQREQEGIGRIHDHLRHAGLNERYRPSGRLLAELWP